MRNIISVLFVLLGLSGCTSMTYTDSNDASHILIDKVQSRVASVRLVSLKKNENGLRVQGQVKRNVGGRVPLFGHVHIDAIGADDGALLSRTKIFKHTSGKNRTVWFSVLLSIDASSVEVVRITPHYQSHPS